MTGIERNADVVTMASYAPLFAHVTDWQWTPDLIWFDNARSYATPNYYVQQLFSVNKGTEVVPLLYQGQPLTGQDSCWASACMDDSTHELIIKLVNPSGSAQQRTIELADAWMTGNVEVTVLSAADAGTVNSLDSPATIAPTVSQLSAKGKDLPIDLSPHSLTVVRVPLRNK